MNNHQIELFAKDLFQLQRNNLSQAEKTFQSLSHEQQISLIQNSPSNISREIIFLAKDARNILKELPNQKFGEMALQEYLEDSLILLSNCTPEQFSFSLNVDIWRQGKIDQSRFLDWVEVIKEIPKNQFKNLTKSIDINLLSTCLKKYVTINLDSSELILMEHLGDQHQYSMHDVHIENAEIEAFVQYIFFTDQEFFGELISNMALGDEEEILNEAKGEKDDRLAKEKLPSYEEAMMIYTLLPDFDLSILTHLAKTSDFTEAIVVNTNNKINQSYFDQIRQLDGFSELLKPKNDKDIIKSLAILVNYTMVADGVSPSDEFKYREALKKSNSIFNIGLEYLSERNHTRGIDILKTHTATEIFQAAYSLLVHIRERASAILHDEEEILVRYSKQTTMLLRFIDQDIPMLYNETIKKATPISSLTEVLYLHHQLNQIEDQRKEFH